ncbi:MAG: hypothetical protein FJY58_10350 [Betaproteobacteria bacterium]|nr:hypothetical protein [Betaproteobacteria bacterium]
MISAIDSAVFLTEATGLAMVESLSSSVREAYCAGSYLDMQFFNLFNERMIVLKKIETFYGGILSAFPKVKVIVPNLLDGHSQTVRRLCMKMNVDLVVLPHGFLGYAQRSGYIYGRYHVGSIFSVHALNSQRFPRDRITLCRKVDAPREYPVASHQSTIAGWKTNKFRVLIVFDPASDTDKRIAVTLASHIGLSAQLRGLKACSSLIDFCDVDVLFKPHPSIPERELYHLADPRILSRCLPPLADLFYFADKADLVVCLNYLGVALKHLSQLRKPIIHFVTSARIGYFSNMGHDFDSAPLLDAGMVVREPSELVEAVHRCTLDTNTLDRLRSQSDQFYKAWFDTFELES